MTTQKISWWEPIELQMDQVLKGQLGPLRLSVQRFSGEWKLEYSRTDETPASVSSLDLMSRHSVVADAPPKESHRFLLPDTVSRVHFRPKLADRSIVSRPEMPLVIAARYQVTLYLTSPLWLEVNIGESSTEIPSWRPSDTWFGPTTTLGELAYASKTLARIRSEDVPQRSHRVISSVTLENRSDTAFTVQRILLPTENLAIYRDAQNRLWTDSLKYIRTSSDAASMELDDLKKPAIEGKQKLTEARKEPEHRTLARTLTSLLK